jgi:hypothetical protein
MRSRKARAVLASAIVALMLMGAAPAASAQAPPPPMSPEAEAGKVCEAAAGLLTNLGLDPLLQADTIEAITSHTCPYLYRL